MGRFTPLLVGILGSVALVTAATAQSPGVLVSGQAMIAIIDGNGDGPGAGDGDFMATLDANNMFHISAMQDTHTPLRACAGGYYGDLSRMGNLGEVNFAPNGSDIPAGSLSQGLMVNLFSPSSHSPLTLGRPGDTVTVIYSGAQQGSGVLLCNAGGPASRVSIPGAPSMLVGLSFFPSSGTPLFLKIPHLPLQLWINQTPGSFSFFDAYIPVTPNGHITMALSSAPGDLLFDTDLNGLPGCHLAPTATEWGLVILTLSMLAIGAWGLGLRPGYQSLATL